MSNPPSPSFTSLWQRIALFLTLLLAILLNFYNLALESYSNLYYAAGVYSMGQNWHAFFFNSYDPAGFVSIDKPPLGLWLQVLSTKIFGFYGWALILPQALAGVLSVWLIYYLVRRSFGVNAGLIAALVLAVTPISVAANRNNTMDSVLVFTSLLAAWAVMLAAERGQLRWLLFCGLLVGLGFEIKMLQAFLVLPAFYLVYFFTAQTTWRRRAWHLALASLVIGVVSLAWPLAVDLTPAEKHPYVGSSENNTVMELIVGHNGAKRLGQMVGLLGMQVGDDPGARAIPQGNLPPRGAQPPVASPPGSRPGQPAADNPPGSNAIPGSANRGHETGDAGLLRLFNRQLAGQISWFLPLALFFVILIPLASCLNPDYLSNRLPVSRFSLLWAAWLIPQGIFFSFAGLFHRHYLAMLAPAIAALVGAGLTLVLDAYHSGGWRRGWLLAAVVVIAATQYPMIAAFPDFSLWLIPMLLLVTAILLLLCFTLRHWSRLAMVFAGLLFILPFVVPLIWSLIPVIYGGNASLPFAGPELIEKVDLTWSAPNTLAEANRLADYLRQNQGKAVYIVATPSSMQASPLILLTGQPVMALGGFGGSDNILSVDDFAKMVSEGQVRFVLVQDSPQGDNRPPQNTSRQSQIMQWVMQNCAPVDGFPLLDCFAKP